MRVSLHCIALHSCLLCFLLAFSATKGGGRKGGGRDGFEESMSMSYD